jgi:hypothetical protein
MNPSVKWFFTIQIALQLLFVIEPQKVDTHIGKLYFKTVRKRLRLLSSKEEDVKQLQRLIRA